MCIDALNLQDNRRGKFIAATSIKLAGYVIDATALETVASPFSNGCRIPQAHSFLNSGSSSKIKLRYAQG
jgi:hypothetical protein